LGWQFWRSVRSSDALFSGDIIIIIIIIIITASVACTLQATD